MSSGVLFNIINITGLCSLRISFNNCGSFYKLPLAFLNIYIANCLCKKLQNQKKIMILFLIAGFVIRHTKT